MSGQAILPRDSRGEVSVDHIREASAVLNHYTAQLARIEKREHIAPTIPELQLIHNMAERIAELARMALADAEARAALSEGL